MASEISASNPELLESLRRNVANQNQPDGSNNSNESSSMFRFQKVYLNYLFFFDRFSSEYRSE